MSRPTLYSAVILSALVFSIPALSAACWVFKKAVWPLSIPALVIRDKCSWMLCAVLEDTRRTSRSACPDRTWISSVSYRERLVLSACRSPPRT